MSDNASLMRANALAIPLRDESVDLIVTSPPYFALRSYQDGGEHYQGQIGSEATPAAFLAALWAVTDECWRVLKPSGSLWVNLGDKYAGSGGYGTTNGNAKHMRGPGRYNQTADVRPKSKMLLPHRYALGCADPDYRRWVERYAISNGPQWVLRSDVVWSKPNGLPESVTDRVRSSHEYLFHLTKEGTYYADADAVREPYSPDASERRLKYGRTEADGYAAGNSENLLGKLPGSVWTIPTEPLTVPDWLDVDHYAAFPTELPRRIILGWSPTGICTTCREARAAVIERHPLPRDAHPNRGRYAASERNDGGYKYSGQESNAWKAAHPDRITGYRCACPDATAPTRPAIVLDLFSGTGTTAMIARALGRYGIGIDLSADYLRLARWRVFDSGHWDKAVTRTTGRPCQTADQVPGQLSLLGGL